MSNESDFNDLLESAESAEEEDEVNPVKHSKLIENIKALYGSKNVHQRVEASRNVSEFDFSRDGGLTAFDMLKDLNNTQETKKKRNKLLKSKKKAAALPVPLPKVAMERLQRGVAYAKTSEEMKKWEPFVEFHDNSDQIEFPLDDGSIKFETGAEFIGKFQPGTKLEEEIEKLLSSSQHRLETDAALSQFEEQQLRSLSKEEAFARLTELRRIRVLMHTEAHKNRRIRKIKSRKFHRIQRKDKMKQALREFEQLKVTDPKRALEKLEELEKIRREERVSLRHKTKNKWASQIARRGKNDKDSQAALRQRIELGRALETKVKLNSETEENESDMEGTGDAEEDDREREQSPNGERNQLERSLHEEEKNAHEENPWLRRTFFEEIKQKSEEGELYTDELHNEKIHEKLSEGAHGLSTAYGSAHKGEIFAGRKCKQNELPGEEAEETPPMTEDSRLDGELSMSCRSSSETRQSPHETPEKKKRKRHSDLPASAVCIDPAKILEVGSARELKSCFNAGMHVDSDNELALHDNDERQRELIQEAFAGDDVVEDFIKVQKEKDAAERKAEREAVLKQKGLDGDWVTPSNINILDHRKERFSQSKKPFKPQAAIVNSDADLRGIKKLKAVDLPRGYTSVSQFEAVLKQPVGSQFNTSRAFNELTKPRIKTRIGKLIHPIDKTALMEPMRAVFKQVKH